MGSSNDFRIDETRSIYEKSPPEVKDLARMFFSTMDINGNGSVDFKEIQSFLQVGNFHIRPHHQRTLFNQLDRNHDDSLDFDEFISFFYIVFMRARCARCNKWLIGKKRRTCVECFMSANDETYDICRTCFYTHRNNHHHPRSQLRKYEELVFKGQVPGHENTNNGMELEPRHEQFRRLYSAFQLAAAGVTVAAFGIGIVGACSIM